MIFANRGHFFVNVVGDDHKWRMLGWLQKEAIQASKQLGDVLTLLPGLPDATSTSMSVRTDVRSLCTSRSIHRVSYLLFARRRNSRGQMRMNLLCLCPSLAKLQRGNHRYGILLAPDHRGVEVWFRTLKMSSTGNNSFTVQQVKQFFLPEIVINTPNFDSTYSSHVRCRTCQREGASEMK